MQTILHHTNNLIRLFLHSRGHDEVPPQFYLWSFLATMAACVQDRVTVTQLVDRPVYPNLYTILCGPAGCGKGTAIDACMQLTKDITKTVNVYEGFINGPALAKHLHQCKLKQDPISGRLIGSKVFLVMEELGAEAGHGKEAEQLIKYLTKLWKPHPGLLEKETIHEGRYALQDTCINFLGGSTRQWIFKVMSYDDFLAGPGRRLIVIEGSVDSGLRYCHVTPPSDREMVVEYIKGRLKLLTQLEGVVEKTDACRIWEDLWYTHREAYKSEMDIPRWKQQPELMNQIAILLVLADGGELKMQQKHMQQALRLTIDAQEGLPRIIEAARTQDSGLLSEVYAVVRDNPGLTWGQLVDKTGLMTFRLQGVLTTLVQAGKVFTFTGLDKMKRYSTNGVFQRGNKKTEFNGDGEKEE